MPQKLISVGSVASDATYDSPRTMAIKVNENFAEVYAGVAGASNFTQTGSGTLTRSSQDKIGEIVSLTDFAGADPTGITSSSVAFNNAIKSNRTLIVPPGTWLIGATIGAANISDFCMVLENGATIKHASTLINKCIKFDNATRLRITGRGTARIDASVAPNSQTGQANDCVYIGGVDLEVDHISFYSGETFSAAGGDSHIFFAGINGKFHHNTHQGAVDVGVYISGPGGNEDTFHTAKVTDCHFINCKNACGGKRRFRGITFSNNTVMGGENGFFTGEADLTQLPGYQNVVTGNRFEGMLGPVAISRISDHDIISNNLIINCTSAIIIALQGAKQTTVSNNTVVNNPAVYVSPSTQQFVRLETRTLNAIDYYSTDNFISGNNVDGVYTAFRENGAEHDRNQYINNKISGATTAYALAGTKSFFSDAQTRRLQGISSGFSGTEMVETQISANLSGAGVVNTFTLALPNSRACRIEVESIGNTTSSNAVFGSKIQGVFKRQIGQNITQIGTTTVSGIGTDMSDGAGGSANVAFLADAGAQAIRVQVTKPAGTSWWVFNIRYTILITNA